jgi:hypothetical protein
MGYNSVTWSAPVLIVASAAKEAGTGMVDVALALSSLDLAAPKLGLGTCWAGLVEGALQGSDALRDSVGLPKGNDLSQTGIEEAGDGVGILWL